MVIVAPWKRAGSHFNVTLLLLLLMNLAGSVRIIVESRLSDVRADTRADIVCRSDFTMVAEPTARLKDLIGRARELLGGPAPLGAPAPPAGPAGAAPGGEAGLGLAMEADAGQTIRTLMVELQAKDALLQEVRHENNELRYALSIFHQQCQGLDGLPRHDQVLQETEGVIKDALDQLQRWGREAGAELQKIYSLQTRHHPQDEVQPEPLAVGTSAWVHRMLESLGHRQARLQGASLDIETCYGWLGRNLSDFRTVGHADPEALRLAGEHLLDSCEKVSLSRWRNPRTRPLPKPISKPLHRHRHAPRARKGSAPWRGSNGSSRDSKIYSSN